MIIISLQQNESKSAFKHAYYFLYANIRVLKCIEIKNRTEGRGKSSLDSSNCIVLHTDWYDSFIFFAFFEELLVT